MPGCALGQCRSWSLERATELESRLFLTEKESTNMQQSKEIFFFLLYHSLLVRSG